MLLREETAKRKIYVAFILNKFCKLKPHCVGASFGIISPQMYIALLLIA